MVRLSCMRSRKGCSGSQGRTVIQNPELIFCHGWKVGDTADHVLHGPFFMA